MVILRLTYAHFSFSHLMSWRGQRLC